MFTQRDWWWWVGVLNIFNPYVPMDASPSVDLYGIYVDFMHNAA